MDKFIIEFVDGDGCTWSQTNNIVIRWDGNVEDVRLHLLETFENHKQIEKYCSEKINEICNSLSKAKKTKEQVEDDVKKIAQLRDKMICCIGKYSIQADDAFQFYKRESLDLGEDAIDLFLIETIDEFITRKENERFIG